MRNGYHKTCSYYRRFYARFRLRDREGGSEQAISFGLSIGMAHTDRTKFIKEHDR